MSGINGLNIIERAAIKNMGIASFKTKDGSLVTIMRNPQTQASAFQIKDLKSGELISSGECNGPKAAIKTDRLLHRLRVLAENVEDFERASERSLEVVV